MNFRRKEKALILSRTSSECLNQDTELQLNPSKVPSITELLAIGHKLPNASLLSYLLSTLHENNSLKTYLLSLQKELSKLQQINKFLLTAQQNRDSLISELTHENKKLKNNSNRKMPNQTNPKILTEKSIEWITPLKKKEVEISSFPYLAHTANKTNQLNPKLGSRITMGKRLSTLLTEGSIAINLSSPKSGSQMNNPNKTPGRVREEKMTHEYILNMNIINQKDSFKSYQEIKTIGYLHPILDEEDSFITHVTGSDFSSLITLYDNLSHLFTDHRTLYSLVFRLKKIIKACNSMTETLVLNEAMERIVDETCECLECDRASVFMLDEQNEELWTKAAKGTTKTIRIPMKTGIGGSVLQEGKVVNIMNAYADERFNKDIDLKNKYKTNTILCSPIMDTRGRNIGVIQAINKINGYFTKDDEGLLTILANLAGIVLRNSISYDEQLLFHNSLRHILKAGVELNSLFSFDNIIPKAEIILKNAMNTEKAKIFLVRRAENKLELLQYQEDSKIQVFQGNCGIAGFTASTGIMQNLTNAYNDPKFNGQIDIETSMPLICMPITHPLKGNEVLGVIEILNTKGIEGLSAFHKSKINHQDYEILDFFSLQLAQTIINNQKLAELIENSSKS